MWMHMFVSNVSSFHCLALHTSDNGTTFTGQDLETWWINIISYTHWAMTMTEGRNSITCSGTKNFKWQLQATQTNEIWSICLHECNIHTIVPHALLWSVLMWLLWNSRWQTGSIGMAQLSGSGDLLVRWVCRHISCSGWIWVTGVSLLWRGHVQQWTRWRGGRERWRHKIHW